MNWRCIENEVLFRINEIKDKDTGKDFGFNRGQVTKGRKKMRQSLT